MKKNKKIPKFKNEKQENAEIGSLGKLYPFAKVRPLQVNQPTILGIAEENLLNYEVKEVFEFFGIKK